MAIIQKTVRSAAITVAVLFIGLSLLGILGVWWVDHRVTGIALKGFGLVQTAAGVVDAGVARADDLVATSRTEVRQASETITAVGPRAPANGPVLSALNDRLETSLAARIAQMQQVLAPVRDAVGTIADAVSLLNTDSGIVERAPWLAALDETFNRLEGLSADAKQLRGTLAALAAAQTNELTPETVATLNGLTQRIDTRLGEVQASLHGVQADIAALQARLDARKSRMLRVFNLLALLATLMLGWIVYSQIVVIRHYRATPNRDPECGAPASAH